MGRRPTIRSMRQRARKLRQSTARSDGNAAVIASEATRSRGTQGARRFLDCFVAPLFAMTIPSEHGVL
jgi:hypothetical protein